MPTKLVQQLCVPESGRIQIDGIDLTVIDATWLRRQIGSVESMYAERWRRRFLRKQKP